MVRAMSRTRFKDRKGTKDLMLMLGFNETIDPLAMTNNVHCKERMDMSRKKHKSLKLKVKGRKGGQKDMEEAG